MDIVVTPWISDTEWREVYNMIISLEAEQLLKAEEIIATWQTRVDRLPTGVETTLCLIQAALAWCENPDSLSLSLTFSSAIIRFLNLTSHVGMNKFGLKKIHEVAEKFSIPARLVELRHDTTHGEMKSKETLLEGLALALQWTITNYWQWEAEHKSANFEDVDLHYQNEASTSNDNSKIWLECYQYLKIYSIWGNETLGELKSDPDTYDHVTSLWNQLTVSNKHTKGSNGQMTPKTKRRKKSLNPVEIKTDDFDQVRIREALGLIRNELKSWISQRNTQSNGDKFVKTLIDETLLLSDRDFVESLLEESEMESKLLTSLRQEARLPQNLAKSWSDILKLTSETGLLPTLISNLYAVSGDLNPRHSNSFSKDLATAWICDILRSLQLKAAAQTTVATPSKKSKQRMSTSLDSKDVSHLQLSPIDCRTDPVWQSLFMDMIMNPNERTGTVLPIIVKMIEPPLTSIKEKKIHDVMDIFLGKKLSDVSKKVVASDIKTLDSLVNASLKSCGKWCLVEQVDWENVPFGLCPGQSEDSFLRDLKNLNCNSLEEDVADSPNFKNSKLTFLQDSTLTIEAKDWAALNGGSRERYERHQSPNITNGNVPAFYRAR